VSNLEFSKNNYILYYIINMNVNNGTNNRIPFQNNPYIFKKTKSTKNKNIKITISDFLKCIIPFFGEIEIDGNTYYRYACYVMNGRIYYLTLEENMVPKRTFKKSNSNLLTFSSSSSITQPQIPSINLKTLQDFKKELVVVKIPKNHVKYDLNTLLEYLKSQNSIKENITVQLLNRNIRGHNNLHSGLNLRNIRQINTTRENRETKTTLKRKEYNGNTFLVDPDHLILSDLRYSDTPFKVIRKSLKNFTRINHPFIFFGEIVIDGIKYYRYVCYNSKDIGSFNGVAFRELVDGRNKRIPRISRIRTNLDAKFLNHSNSSDLPTRRNTPNVDVSKKYLYYIPIEEITSVELRILIKNMDEYRRQKNSSFSKTIYDYVKGELQARGEENENSPFALKNNGITNSNL